MLQKISIDGVPLTLATPDTHESHWIDYNDYLRQLEAAWLRLSDNELILNPRIVGEPGLGKTSSGQFRIQQPDNRVCAHLRRGCIGMLLQRSESRPMLA